MADIRMVWDQSRGIGDWSIDGVSQSIWTDENGNSIVDENGKAIDALFTAGGDLSRGSDLYTAILISLFTDATAADDDTIADGSDDPRGWWAGAIGSKLWLRERSRATQSLLAVVKNDIEQALAWLIADDVVAGIEVTTEYTRPALLGAQVVLKRRDGTRAALRFSRLWETA
jgi:phage gp46-like protein